MHWRVFVYAALSFLALFCFVFPAGAVDDGGAIGGRYSAHVVIRKDEGTSVTRHEFILPWGYSRFGEELPSVGGTVAVEFEHQDDGAFSWNSGVTLESPKLSTAIFVKRPHRSSEDPFKLVHATSRGENSVAAVLDWTGAVTATVHYVRDVPLRRDGGTLLSARVRDPALDGAIGVTAYGTERVQHVFVTADGRTMLRNRPFQWGAALLRGVEVTDGGGPGLFVHRRVQDGALFVRSEWGRGTHNGWIRLHATGRDFRSLAAQTYPFSRGKAGIEGRWQWRLATGKLLSVYGERLQSLHSGMADTEATVEFSYSSMVRNEWGWKLSLEGRAAEDHFRFGRLEASLTNPDRQFEWTIRTMPDRGGPMRWRHGLQWNEGRWRGRIVMDESFGAWRVEAGMAEAEGWSWTVVYKMPFAHRSDLPDTWLHGEIRRYVHGFGHVWIRYMEPDLGRIDVGWRRLPTLSVGVDVAF